MERLHFTASVGPGPGERLWRITYLDEGEARGRGWRIGRAGLEASLPIFQYVWVQSLRFEHGFDHLHGDVRAAFPEGVISGNIIGLASSPQLEEVDGRWAVTGIMRTASAQADKLLALAAEAGRLGDFGLSINAESDDAHVRVLAGGVKEVDQLDRMFSVDLVTYPARGGAVRELLASAGFAAPQNSAKEARHVMTLKDKIRQALDARQVAYNAEAASPLELLASVDLRGAEPAGVKEMINAIMSALKSNLDDVAENVLAAMMAGPGEPAEPVQASRGVAPESGRALSEMAARLERLERQQQAAAVQPKLAALPDDVQALLASHKAGPEVVALVAAAIDKARIDDSGHVQLPRARVGLNSPDKLREATYALLASKKPADGIAPLRGIQDAYIQATGDTYMDAFMGRPVALQASNGLFQPSDFPYLLGDAMNRAIVDFYGEYEKWWQQVGRYRRGIRNFKDIKINRVDGMGLLDKFEDAHNSTGIVRMAIPGEAQGTYAVDIYSNKLLFSFKFIRDDDIDALDLFLKAAAFTCYSTVSYYGFAMLINLNLGTGIVNGLTSNYSGAALYSAANKNLLTKPLSYESAQEAKLMLMSQKHPGTDGRNLRQTPWGLWYAIPLSGVADVIVDSEKAPNNSSGNVNTLSGLKKIPVAVEDLADNPNLWGMITNPQQRAVVQYAFLDDVDTPWIAGTTPNQTSGQPWDFLRTEYRAVMMFGVGQESHEAGVLGFPQ